jgi:hypothetical protein
VFDGSEALLLRYQRRPRNGAAPMKVRLQDESDYRWNGTLDFTDNAIDAASGVVRLRATDPQRRRLPEAGHVRPRPGGRFQTYQRHAGARRRHRRRRHPPHRLRRRRRRHHGAQAGAAGAAVDGSAACRPLGPGNRTTGSSSTAVQRVQMPGQKVQATNGRSSRWRRQAPSAAGPDHDRDARRHRDGSTDPAMNISKFFIDRPIFAAVIAIFITLIGVFAYPQLPLSQYPEIAPPTITVNAAYPGASAETLAETVAAPIEQEINGVEGMLYLSSSSTSDGRGGDSPSPSPGTDLDAAQVLVQNRVSLAEPRLPAQVRQIGVTVNKAGTGFLMIVALTSDIRRST